MKAALLHEDAERRRRRAFVRIAVWIVAGLAVVSIAIALWVLA